MKIKNVIVEIKPLKDALNEFAETLSKVKKGKKVIPKKSIGFSNVQSFRRFFSPKRMELLHFIKKHNPRSIYQLAKLTNRGYKNVHDDVELLKELDLITVDKRGVEVDFTKLSIEIAV